MGYLPIFLDVGERPCIVIGGSELAEAKIRALLDAGAIVTVISSEASDWIKLQVAAGKICYIAREYEHGDLRGNALAYIATDSLEVARCAVDEARELGIPLNVIDNPESSTFISPATFRRGDLQIAISTGGASPAVARMIRQGLEAQIGPEYSLMLDVMRRARRFLRNREPNQRARARILRSLARTLLDSVRGLDYLVIDEALKLHLNAGMADLGLQKNGGPTGTIGSAPAVIKVLQ